MTSILLSKKRMMGILALTLSFIVLDIYLILNVIQVQKEVRQNVTVITRLSELESTIQDFETALDSVKTLPSHTLWQRYWQERRADYDSLKRSIYSMPVSDSVVQTFLNSADTSMDHIDSLMNQGFTDSAYIAHRDTLEKQFRAEIKAATLEVAASVRRIREQMGLLSASLARSWNYLTILSLGACLLAILLAVSSYRHHSTLRKRDLAERALRQITAEFRAMFKAIPDAVVFTDGTDEILMVNPAFTELFGYLPEEVIGQNILLLQSKYIYAGRYNFSLDLLSTDPEKQGREKIYQRKNGDWFLCETVSATVYDDHGKLFGTVSILRDITERKKTERALQASQARNRAILEAIPDMIFRVSRNGTFLDFKAPREEDLMVEPDKIAGSKMSDFFAGELLEKIMRGIDSALVKQETRLIEYQLEPLKGGLRDYEARIAPCGKEEVLIIVRDISDRKAYERALREMHDRLERAVAERTEDLVRANEELKRFAYIVSHDLRAPLVNIKGFSGELHEAFETIHAKLARILPLLTREDRDQLEEILLDEIPEALQFIDTSASRMGHLIDAVLKLSRVGRREMYFLRQDTFQIVQKTLETLAHQIDQKGVEITVGDLPEVVADATALEQIFSNILVNAINYLVPGRPGKIAIEGEEREEDVIFHLRDNGRGIPPEEKTKIFEPFRRVGNPEVPGEGMGLAYVQILVHRHGGRIWCESQPGIGTTFSFTLARNVGNDDTPAPGTPRLASNPHSAT